MTCLDDRQLVDVYYGDGSAAERAHASGCRSCRARVSALTRDLRLVDTVLRSTAPPRSSRRYAKAWQTNTWRWASVAVAAVLALAVALERPMPTPVQSAAIEDDTDVLALADEVSDAITSDVGFYDDGTGTARTSSTCTWGDPLLGVGCEQSAMQQIAWR